MYISLLNSSFYTFSFDFYHNVKERFNSYIEAKKDKVIMLHINNIFINKIFFDKGKYDRREILRFYFYQNPNLNHLIFNIYNNLFEYLESLKLKSNSMYSLNTLVRYKPKDLFKTELNSLYTGATSWLKVNMNDKIITLKFYELMSLDKNNIVKNVNNFKDLIEHFHKNEDFLSAYKNNSSKDLENIVLNMLRIFIMLKDRYLIETDFKDVISVIGNKSNSDYNTILYVVMYFFYHTGNIIVNVILSFSSSGFMNNYEKVVKFFISLDNILCYYKDMTGQIIIKRVDDREIYEYKKNIINSKYIERKRTNKIVL